jgi:hypothetical protein
MYKAAYFDNAVECYNVFPWAIELVLDHSNDATNVGCSPHQLDFVDILFEV